MVCDLGRREVSGCGSRISLIQLATLFWNIAMPQARAAWRVVTRNSLAAVSLTSHVQKSLPRKVCVCVLKKCLGKEVFKAAKAGVQITSRLLTCGPARNVCRSFGKQFQLGVAPKEPKISLSLEERDRSLLLQGCQQTGLNS